MRFSESVKNFHGKPLPESAIELAGYSALVNYYNLRGPLPVKLAGISHKHRRYDTDDWAIYTPRYKPEETLASQLTFAMKYEGIDLYILKQLFLKIHSREIVEWIKKEPTSQYSRRIWFLYEWLTEKTLDLQDVKTGNFVNLLDEKKYYTGPIRTSSRHRIRNNLPGIREYCPLIRRTPKLDEFIKMQLNEEAHKKTGAVHPDVLARAAAFLLLKDSRASFEIEGEHPGKNRAERWGRAIGQAGMYPLSLDELIRLQSIVIEDRRFVHLGLRKEGGFIGVHERATGSPLPDHISARPEDLPDLIKGLIETYALLKENDLDAVLYATLIAFGFVFIHPFEDGNGRIHRYIIHHILGESGFSPRGIVFPISSVILEHIDTYRKVLEEFSKPRLELIEWQSTPKGNVEVLNDTRDLYRYFDATPQAEFLYECVWQTVNKILPEEILYLQRHDQMKQRINEHFDMPNYLIDLLIQFLQQNKGVLSKRAREKEFKSLSDKECHLLEKMYLDVFDKE